MLSDSEHTERDEFIAGIRALADWMDAHENMPAPDSMNVGNVYASSRDHLLELRRRCGLREKFSTDDCLGNSYIGFRKVFSANVRLELFSTKDRTCDRVEVGTKIIPAKPEFTVPATPETIVPVYEWRCPESLLLDDDTNELVAAESQQPA